MGGGADVSLLSEIAGYLVCAGAFDCNLDFDNYGGIVLWLLIMVYMFKALGVICDEYFVPSLEVIVVKLKLSNDVAGATFMAAGSSAPEFFTSLVATFVIVSEGGVGTIVGSAIFNILVIVGLTAYVACAKQDLKIWWYPLTRDTFFYVLAIIEIVIALVDEKVEWYEGFMMLVTYIFYCLYMKVNPMVVEKLGLLPAEVTIVEPEVGQPSQATQAPEKANGDLRQAGAAEKDAVPGPPEHHLSVTPGDEGACAGPHHCTVEAPEVIPPKPEELISAPPGPEGRPATLIVQNPEMTFKPRPSWSLKEAEQKAREVEKEAELALKGIQGEQPEENAAATAAASSERDEDRRCKCRDPMVIFLEYTMPTAENYCWLLFSLSIFWIGVATYVMVDATDRTGKILHIPKLAMARVFLAAGTSIPDALGSIAVAKQGEGDMAVSNALGSNVFDILIGLGIPWMIKTGFMGEEVSFKGKWDELVYDIIALVIVLVLFVGALVVHRWYLTRRVGILLLVFYGVFLLYNVLAVYVFKIVEVEEE